MYLKLSMAMTTGYGLFIYHLPLENLQKIILLGGLLLVKAADFKWGSQEESILYETEIMPAFVKAVEKKFGIETNIFTEDKENPQKLHFNSEKAKGLLNDPDENQEKTKER